MTFPVLFTARLSLRPPTPADEPAYVAFYGRDEKSLSYQGGQSAEAAAETLAEDIAHWRDRGHGLWLLRLRGEGGDEAGEGPVIGAAGLAQDEGWPAELTWWLFETARGDGYAAEASRAAIEFGYGVLGWPRVETWMKDGNAAAVRLARRLGGVFDRREAFPDGLDRDIYLLPREGSS